MDLQTSPEEGMGLINVADWHVQVKEDIYDRNVILGGSPLTEVDEHQPLRRLKPHSSFGSLRHGSPQRSMGSSSNSANSSSKSLLQFSNPLMGTNRQRRDVSRSRSTLRAKHGDHQARKSEYRTEHRNTEFKDENLIDIPSTLEESMDEGTDILEQSVSSSHDTSLYALKDIYNRVHESNNAAVDALDSHPRGSFSSSTTLSVFQNDGFHRGIQPFGAKSVSSTPIKSKPLEVSQETPSSSPVASLRDKEKSVSKDIGQSLNVSKEPLSLFQPLAVIPSLLNIETNDSGNSMNEEDGFRYHDHSRNSTPNELRHINTRFTMLPKNVTNDRQLQAVPLIPMAFGGSIDSRAVIHRLKKKEPELKKTKGLLITEKELELVAVEVQQRKQPESTKEVEIIEETKKQVPSAPERGKFSLNRSTIATATGAPVVSEARLQRRQSVVERMHIHKKLRSDTESPKDAQTTPTSAPESPPVPVEVQPTKELSAAHQKINNRLLALIPNVPSALQEVPESQRVATPEIRFSTPEELLLPFDHLERVLTHSEGDQSKLAQRRIRQVVQDYSGEDWFQIQAKSSSKRTTDECVSVATMLLSKSEKKQTFLKTLPPRLVTKICSQQRLEVFAEHQLVYQQAEQCDSFYFVLQGRTHSFVTQHGLDFAQIPAVQGKLTHVVKAANQPIIATLAEALEKRLRSLQKGDVLTAKEEGLLYTTLGELHPEWVCSYTEGDEFGHAEPWRSNTVRCATDCIFATLPMVLYEECLQYTHKSIEEQTNKRKFVSTVQPLSTLTPAMQAVARQQQRKVEAQQGDCQYLEGDPVDGLYFVVQGQVQMSKTVRLPRSNTDNSLATPEYKQLSAYLTETKYMPLQQRQQQKIRLSGRGLVTIQNHTTGSSTMRGIAYEQPLVVKVKHGLVGHIECLLSQDAFALPKHTTVDTFDEEGQSSSEEGSDVDYSTADGHTTVITEPPVPPSLKFGPTPAELHIMTPPLDSDHQLPQSLQYGRIVGDNDDTFSSNSIYKGAFHSPAGVNRMQLQKAVRFGTNKRGLTNYQRAQKGEVNSIESLKKDKQSSVQVQSKKQVREGFVVTKTALTSPIFMSAISTRGGSCETVNLQLGENEDMLSFQDNKKTTSGGLSTSYSSDFLPIAEVVQDTPHGFHHNTNNNASTNNTASANTKSVVKTPFDVVFDTPAEPAMRVLRKPAKPMTDQSIVEYRQFSATVTSPTATLYFMPLQIMQRLFRGARKQQVQSSAFSELNYIKGRIVDIAGVATSDVQRFAIEAAEEEVQKVSKKLQILNGRQLQHVLKAALLQSERILLKETKAARKAQSVLKTQSKKIGNASGGIGGGIRPLLKIINNAIEAPIAMISPNTAQTSRPGTPTGSRPNSRPGTPKGNALAHDIPLRRSRRDSMAHSMLQGMTSPIFPNVLSPLSKSFSPIAGGGSIDDVLESTPSSYTMSTTQRRGMARGIVHDILEREVALVSPRSGPTYSPGTLSPRRQLSDITRRGSIAGSISPLLTPSVSTDVSPRDSMDDDTISESIGLSSLIQKQRMADRIDCGVHFGNMDTANTIPRNKYGFTGAINSRVGIKRLVLTITQNLTRYKEMVKRKETRISKMVESSKPRKKGTTVHDRIHQAQVLGERVPLILGIGAASVRSMVNDMQDKQGMKDKSRKQSILGSDTDFVNTYEDIMTQHESTMPSTSEPVLLKSDIVQNQRKRSTWDNGRVSNGFVLSIDSEETSLDTIRAIDEHEEDKHKIRTQPVQIQASPLLQSILELPNASQVTVPASQPSLQKTQKAPPPAVLPPIKRERKGKLPSVFNERVVRNALPPSMGKDRRIARILNDFEDTLSIDTTKTFTQIRKEMQNEVLQRYTYNFVKSDKLAETLPQSKALDKYIKVYDNLPESVLEHKLEVAEDAKNVTYSRYGAARLGRKNIKAQSHSSWIYTNSNQDSKRPSVWNYETWLDLDKQKQIPK